MYSCGIDPWTVRLGRAYDGLWTDLAIDRAICRRLADSVERSSVQSSAAATHAWCATLRMLTAN